MKKFNTIYENKLSLDKYISALKDLENAARDDNHALVTSKLIKNYYETAINMGNDNGFFSSKIRRKINKANKDFGNLGSGMKSDNIIVADNIKMILSELGINEEIKELKENTPVADTGSVNGMGDVKLPGDDTIGSGDIPGATADRVTHVHIKEPNEKITMKKFEEITEKRNEVYFPLTDIGDPATLIQELAKFLVKKYNGKLSNVVAELTNIEISYNGLVDELTITDLSKILGTKSKQLKNDLDGFMNENIELLENLQVEFMTKILSDDTFVNESIIGRAIGGIAGFAFGPKIGKIIAKTLGIGKGPLYNVLTSRVVSAALAQELTKNLI